MGLTSRFHFCLVVPPKFHLPARAVGDEIARSRDRLALLFGLDVGVVLGHALGHVPRHGSDDLALDVGAASPALELRAQTPLLHRSLPVSTAF